MRGKDRERRKKRERKRRTKECPGNTGQYTARCVLAGAGRCTAYDKDMHQQKYIPAGISNSINR